MSVEFFWPTTRAPRLHKARRYDPEERPLPVATEEDTLAGLHVLRAKINGKLQISEGCFVLPKRSAHL